MNKNETFLRAIIAAPDDDLPRLVYADWLDEHGEPERAEFIRAQCALARMADNDPQRPASQERERELLDEFGWAWAEEFGPQIDEWVFRRGFVERVQMCLETTTDKILHVLSQAPIRHVRDISQFCDLTGVVEALPHLDRLTGLEFWNLYAVDDQLVAQLLASPHLHNLRTLILHHDRNGNLIGDDVLVEGLAAPHWQSLQELAVNVDGSWRGPSPRVVQAIARSAGIAHLRQLNLSHARLGVNTVRALGRSPVMAGLEELDLGGCSLTAEVWDAILKLPQLPRLKWLRLHGARLVDRQGTHVGELRGTADYARAFEQRAAMVDWDTEYISPWDGTTCWKGLSWEGRRRQPLFAMSRFIRAHDYDGLEAEYRRMCRRLAGVQVTAEIDALPFDGYRAQLQKGLKRAIASLAKNGGQAVYLRVRPDIEWQGRFDIQEKYDPAADQPHEEYSYVGPIEEFPGPQFPEAAQVYQQHPLHAGIHPSGPALYLLARTLAAFGRCVDQSKVRVPVYFSCMYAVFRM